MPGSVADLIAMLNEPLCNELVPWMEESGPLGPMLRHPLVYQLILNPGLANLLLKQKNEEMAKAVKAHDYNQQMWLYERPYRLAFAMQDRDWMAQACRAELLGAAWTDSEWPTANGGGIAALTRAFKAVGYVTDTPDAQLPSGPITIWRGAKPRYKRGMSWTRDPDKAAWFAERGHDGGRVFESTITAKGVLGYFLGRDEVEVVVNTRMLKIKEA